MSQYILEKTSIAIHFQASNLAPPSKKKNVNSTLAYLAERAYRGIRGYVTNQMQAHRGAVAVRLRTHPPLNPFNLYGP